jgi:hypothetical protein
MLVSIAKSVIRSTTLETLTLFSPVHEYWAFPESPNAKCLNEGPVTLAGGIVKTFTDLLITTLPIPLILRMRVEKKQKYGVAILLALGYVATAAGAVRTYFTYKMFYVSPDQTWFEYPAFLAAAVENDIAVVRIFPALLHIASTYVSLQSSVHAFPHSARYGPTSLAAQLDI